MLDRYILRGLIGPSALVMAGAALFMILYRALNLLERLSDFGADPVFFPPMLLALVPNYLDLALPLGFLIGVIVLVTRLEDDFELDAMAAAGVSIARLAKPLMLFGLVLMLISLALRGYGDPWGRYQYRMLEKTATNVAALNNLAPMSIYQDGSSFALTFGGYDRSGGVSDIRLWTQSSDGDFTFYAARRGQVRNPNSAGEITIGLEDGVSAHFIHSDSELQGMHFVDFEQVSLRYSLKFERAAWPRGKDQVELFLHELWRESVSPSGRYSSAAIRAEFWNRVSRAAILPLLPLLFLPMAIATKGAQRGGRLLFAALTIALTHHILNMTKNLAAAGQIPPMPTIVGTVSIFALICLLAFYFSRDLPSPTVISRLASQSMPRWSLSGGRSNRRVGTPPRSGLIAWLVVGKHLKWVVIAMLATITYLLMIDILDRGDDFVERAMTTGEVGQYILLRLPQLTLQAIPIAAVVAAIVTLFSLAGSNEIVVIRSSGISTLRLFLFLLPVAALLCVAISALNEVGVPRSERRLADWWQSLSPDEEAAPKEQWIRAGDDLIFAAREPNTGDRLKQVWLFHNSGDDSAEIVAAVSASARPDGWQFNDVRRWRMQKGSSQAETAAQWHWPSVLTGADVMWVFSGAQSISAREADSHLSRAIVGTVSRSGLETRIMRAWAEPFVPVILTLLVFPLAFVEPRRSAWAALSGAVLLSLFFLASDKTMASFSAVGRLPVLTGSLGAPALGLVFGSMLLTRLRR